MTAFVPCSQQELRGWRSQFACPRGWGGVIAGWLLAVKNRGRSRAVLERLRVGAAARVLEIGFGPGVDLRRVSERVASVAGIDASEVMLAQASRRNRGAIEAGRMDLRLGSMLSLPFGEEFDAAYSINTLPFARDWAAAFAEMHRVLKPGGQLLIAVQPRSKNVTASEMRDRIVAAMQAAGFREIEASLIDMRPAPVACVSALR